MYKKNHVPLPQGPFGPKGWCNHPRSKYTDVLKLHDDGTILARRPGGNADDDVVGISTSPMHRFEQGYYCEIECLTVDPENTTSGCMGLGVTFSQPADLHKLPKRLDRLKQGWWGGVEGGVLGFVWVFRLGGEFYNPRRVEHW